MRTRMLIAGIDPGLSGALAVITAPEGKLAAVVDMPVLTVKRGGRNKREIDAWTLARTIASFTLGHIYLEKSWPRPSDGTIQAFDFGDAYGTVKGILATLGVPMTVISPQIWKRRLLVPAAKDGARARASQLLPASAREWPLAKHHGRAESALIAYYGWRQLTRIADAAE